MVSQRNQVYGYLFSPGMTDILVPTLNAVNERGRECEQSMRSECPFGSAPSLEGGLLRRALLDG